LKDCKGKIISDRWAMELKYYLRGLGLGIAVTAIIMGIASSRSGAMTDEEIIARAKQLGMIEDRVLSDAALEETEASERETSETDTGGGEDAAGVENSPTEKDGSVQSDAAPDESGLMDGNDTVNELEGKDMAEDTAAAVLPDDEETGQEETPAEPEEPEAEEPTESADSDTPMVITVGGGDGSYTVSKKLEDVGAVASASAFDTFLCENGYDKKIRAGSYTIPADAGEEQIARMITGLE